MDTLRRKIYSFKVIMSGRHVYQRMDKQKRSQNNLIRPIITKKRFSHCNKKLLTVYSLYSKAYDSFSMNDSSFLIHKVKESTGRVVMFKEFNIINSFTLECSLCGPSIGLRKDYHYTRKMLFVTCTTLFL